MKKLLMASACLMLLISCGKDNSLDNLSQNDRYFLFGEDESKITFLGWPISGGKPSCNPEDMGQGYSFIQSDKGFFIESIRPSGVERHKIHSIIHNGNNLEIKARNAASLPFSLVFTNIETNSVNISFDGEQNTSFLRCVR